MKTTIVGIVVAIVMILGCFFLYDMSVDNRIAELNNLYTKQMASVETYHDKMWKTIKSQAKVTDKQKDAFKEVYAGIMEGRYKDSGGDMMLWIKEDNPQFDQSSYDKLMTTIEAQRAGFHREQNLIQGVVKEYNDMLVKKPSKWFVDDGVEPLVFVAISSTASKNVMETRQEDELYL